jgi:hypothetical protein
MFGYAMKSLAVAGLVLLPSLASASTVNLSYTGGTSNGGVTITSAVPGTNEVPTPWDVGAFGFNMHDNGSGQNLVAWCLDISDWLGSGNYDTTTTPWDGTSYGISAASKAHIQSLFDANYASLNLADAAQAAGFQAALWNALYDSDWLASAGLFAVKDGTTGATSLADAYLLAAENYTGKRVFNMTFLESDFGGQNLVTVAPVPLPAAGLLLIGALGGLGALRRRRNA